MWNQKLQCRIFFFNLDVGSWESVVCLVSSDQMDAAAETIQVPKLSTVRMHPVTCIVLSSIALASHRSTVLFDVAMYLPLDCLQVAFVLPWGKAGDHFTAITITSESIFIIDSITEYRLFFIHLMQHIWEVSFSQAVCRLFGWAECVCWQQSCKTRDVN